MFFCRYLVTIRLNGIKGEQFADYGIERIKIPVQ